MTNCSTRVKLSISLSFTTDEFSLLIFITTTETKYIYNILNFENQFYYFLYNNLSIDLITNRLTFNNFPYYIINKYAGSIEFIYSNIHSGW